MYSKETTRRDVLLEASFRNQMIENHIFSNGFQCHRCIVHHKREVTFLMAFGVTIRLCLKMC